MCRKELKPGDVVQVALVNLIFPKKRIFYDISYICEEHITLPKDQLVPCKSHTKEFKKVIQAFCAKCWSKALSRKTDKDVADYTKYLIHLFFSSIDRPTLLLLYALLCDYSPDPVYPHDCLFKSHVYLKIKGF